MVDEAGGGVQDSLLKGAHGPAEFTLSLVRAGHFLLADPAQDLADLAVEPSDRPQQRIREWPGRHPVAGRQDRRHVPHPHVRPGTDVPAARGVRAFHGQPVRDGEVADVDDRPAQLGNARDIAGQQAADRFQ